MRAPFVVVRRRVSLIVVHRSLRRRVTLYSRPFLDRPIGECDFLCPVLAFDAYLVSVAYGVVLLSPIPARFSSSPLSGFHFFISSSIIEISGQETRNLGTFER